jgi:tetratricopeptide (TPR) repeat protein
MKKTHAAPRIVSMVCLAALTTVANAATDGTSPPERLGTVDFPVSCSPAVQADFNRGVALLHDFWYEEARPQFERILKKDPGCAMAHWGIAMSGFHQIWDRPDETAVATGWRELQAAQAKPPKTAREREYIAALADFFHPGKAEFQARIDHYATAMGTLYQGHPEDVDAGAFSALAILAAVRPDDTSLVQEHKAMGVLDALWKKSPDNPGVVHYIIHACDTPSMAADGLVAARHYGEIAASGPHAVHMPGHIFARLGLWQEDINSNLASVAASEMAEKQGENGWMDQFHSDDFLVYAYLQSGQEARAREIAAASQRALDEHEGMKKMMADQQMATLFPYYQVKLPIFIALETRDWKALQTLQPIKGAAPETQTQVYWARAIADGELHQGQAARDDLAGFDALMDAVKKGDHAYYAEGVDVQIRRTQILAWVAYANGNTVEAMQQMRAGADLQDKVGQGEVDIPAREMLADILLESGHAQSALIEYKRALTLSPNRFNGLYNAGKAAEVLNNPGEAHFYYASLLKATANGAHSSRPEIQHAKDFVTTANLASAREEQSSHNHSH